MNRIRLLLTTIVLVSTPAAPAVDGCTIGCDGTSALTIVAHPSSCIDLTTLNFGIMSSDGSCHEDCSTLTPCTFTYYANGVAKPGCGAGCTVEYVTGSGPPWKSFGPAPADGYRLENWAENCGGVNGINIYTRCSSACSGACSSPTAQLLGTLAGICTDCVVND